MKKVFLAAVLTSVLFASCDSFSGPSKKELMAKNDSLSSVINQRGAELDDIMSIFNNVVEGIDQINKTEGHIDLQRGKIEGGSMSARERVAADVEFIQKSIQANNELIAQLEEKLNNSRSNSAQLRKAVENLKAELAKKTQKIEELSAELASKNVRIQELDKTVADLSVEKENLLAENASKGNTVAEQDKALNAAWYVVAKKKDLKAGNILTNTGLFKKGDIMEDANVDKNSFSQIDIREVKEIALNSKSAKILSTHPENSYSLSEDADGYLTLNIINPQDFWSVTRYLVVRVK